MPNFMKSIRDKIVELRVRWWFWRNEAQLERDLRMIRLGRQFEREDQARQAVIDAIAAQRAEWERQWNEPGAHWLNN